jgi:hypothetical protein
MEDWQIAVGTTLVCDRSSEYVAVHSSGYDTSVRWLTSSCDGVRSADGKSDARPSMPVCHAEEIAESTSASLSV